MGERKRMIKKRLTKRQQRWPWRKCGRKLTTKDESCSRLGRHQQKAIERKEKRRREEREREKVEKRVSDAVSSLSSGFSSADVPMTFVARKHPSSSKTCPTSFLRERQ